MKQNLLLILLAATTVLNAGEKKQENQSNRQIWLSYMDKVARPVIQNLANDELKENMELILSDRIDNPESRKQVAYLEAFARTLSGISPWLEGEGGTPEEIELRNQYRKWSLKAIEHAVDPQANDYMHWTGGQPLVDASFLALALVRSPWLWNNLSEEVQNNTVEALLQTKATIPVYSNWILFSGMIEAFFCKYGFDYDPVRIEYGIREFSTHWYVGDGLFSDGNDFHMDYYNSYVIQPYLINILNAVQGQTTKFNWFNTKMDKIASRYAVILERLIHTDGSFPVTGRSIVYRGAAFQHLADMALQKKLPETLNPAQVRCALTAVIKKTLEASDTFTPDGWLNIGLSGHQPALADFYINTGSLYLCSTIFLPLGLPETDEFWTAPDEPWTSVKVWNGQDVPADHALKLK